MKNIKMGFGITMFILLTCTLSSCDKVWTCDNYYVNLLCVKGTDSIYVSTSVSPISQGAYSSSPSYVQNVVNYYKQKGYVVDTITSGGGNQYLYNAETVKVYEENGVKCAQGGGL